MSNEMSEEVFQTYLKELRIRYGLEMFMTAKRLHEQGYLGENVLALLIGQSPAHPIVPNNLGEQIAQQQSKIKRM